jgi:hypothetical protein
MANKDEIREVIKETLEAEHQKHINNIKDLLIFLFWGYSLVSTILLMILLRNSHSLIALFSILNSFSLFLIMAVIIIKKVI